MNLPPTDFSNYVQDVKPDFDFKNWETSPEWAIFNAGIAHAMNKIQWRAENETSNAIKVIHSVRDKKKS